MKKIDELTVTVTVEAEDIRPAVVDAVGIAVEDLECWAEILQEAEGCESIAKHIRDSYIEPLKEYQGRWEESE